MIDANGNYIENSVSGKHIDHGTAVMKDDKACFTSAMTKDGEVCWTTKPVKIGHSMSTTSDKGESLTVHACQLCPDVDAEITGSPARLLLPGVRLALELDQRAER